MYGLVYKRGTFVHVYIIDKMKTPIKKTQAEPQNGEDLQLGIFFPSFSACQNNVDV